PDPEQAKRETEVERHRLQAVQAGLAPGELGALVEATIDLKRKQEAPDTPQALASIPSLTRDDLPRQNKLIPIEIGALADTTVLTHDLDTNGLIYLDLAFDLKRLAPELLPYLAVFSRALLETGAGKDDFIALSQRIGRDTGGISAQRWTSATVGGEDSAAWLFLHGKATAERADN